MSFENVSKTHRRPSPRGRPVLGRGRSPVRVRCVEAVRDGRRWRWRSGRTAFRWSSRSPGPGAVPS